MNKLQKLFNLIGIIFTFPIVLIAVAVDELMEFNENRRNQNEKN